MLSRMQYYMPIALYHLTQIYFLSTYIQPSKEDKEAWRKLGGNTTTNIPMLEMDDGKVFTQSGAVLRAVGRMGNLLPTDNDGLYTSDKLIEDAEDLRTASYKCFISWGASQESADEFIATVLPLHLGNIERQLKESSGKFFLGDSLSLAGKSAFICIVLFVHLCVCVLFCRVL